MEEEEEVMEVEVGENRKKAGEKEPEGATSRKIPPEQWRSLRYS